MTWIEVCETVLGPSWQTSIFGLLLMALALVLLAAGGVLFAFDQTEFGGIVMAQSVGLLIAGIGLLKTRSEAASNKRAGELATEIQQTNQGLDTKVERAVASEVRQTAVPAATQAAKDTVREELRK